MERQPMPHLKPESGATHQEQDQDELQSTMTFWQERITAWYPDLLSRTYFLPPAHMNRTQYSTKEVAGQEVFVPQTPCSTALPRGDRVSLRESDVRDDEAQQRVLQCLQGIADADSSGDCGAGHAKTPVAAGKGSEAHEEEARAVDKGKVFAQEACTLETEKQQGGAYKEKRAEHIRTQSISAQDACTLDTEKQTQGEYDERRAEDGHTPSMLEQEASMLESERRKPGSCDDDADGNYPTRKTKKEIMFVISGLRFENYLNKHCFTGDRKLPKPSDLKEEKRDRGDFDILVIHRSHGFLVGEIKSVGDKLADKPEQQRHRIIADKIRLAMKQLDKAESVLVHLLSDKDRRPRITKSVFLPNVTAACLRRVFFSFPQLEEELRQCVQVEVSADPIPLCITADVLSNPSQWWQYRMTGAGGDPAMTDAVYLDLVSRFGGPATSVGVFCPSVPRLGRHSDVRTEGEAVSETAWRFTQFVIHPHQLAILRSNLPLVYLTGPPGTGKTLVLILKTLEWVRDGHHVHVVSTWDESLPVSHLIVSQVQKTEPAAKQLVHLRQFDLWKQNEGVDTAVTTLSTLARDGLLHVITDEVGPDSTDPKSFMKTPNVSFRRRYAVFCSTLLHRLPNLRLWAASMYHEDRPDTLTECTLTEPLRTPPTITREVRMCSSLGPGGPVLDYSPTVAPLPSEGFPARVLYHTEDHDGAKPADCERCGTLIAGVLKNELHVGETVTGRDKSVVPPLRYMDVLILIRQGDVQKTQTDAEGNKEKVDCGLVRGLRAQDVPVRPVMEGSGDMATRSGPDEVIVTWSGTTPGLEWKVVVWTRYDEWGEDWGRLLAMSRCTGRLIIVRKP